MSFATNTTDHLVRAQLYSSELKKILEDELMATRYVRMLDQFPDGDTFNIPSIGQAQVLDYAEGQDVQYTSMDTGNFQFVIDQYKHSAHFITNKMKQDSMWADQLMSEFVPSEARAIMSAVEDKVLSVGVDTQTASNSNTINGAKHRWVTSGTNQVIEVDDFAKANYALNKANVPFRNRVAIVDPSVGFHLETITNLTNVSNNPMWEGIIADGLYSDVAFKKNVYGFDVYVSNHLKSGISETIDAVSATTGVANLFFSADSSVTPFIGAWRQAPTVESEYNKDKQREEYLTIARYGFALYRPENFCVCITDTDQIYA
jgi:hypothetical protein